MNDTFRFILINQEPDAFPCCNNTKFSVGRRVECPQPGFSYEMFQIYTSAMGVRPIISWIPNTVEDIGGNDQNGWWTGAFGKILNGTIDTLASTLQETEIRDQFFDFSYPFYQSRLVYLVKSDDKSAIVSALEALLSFSPNVWLLYLATVMVLTICLIATNFANPPTNSKETYESTFDKYSSLLWNFFRYLLDKCEGDIRQRNISGNILLIFSGIAAIIMLSLYESSLLAQLLTEKPSQAFSTVEGMAKLIKAKQYKFVFDNPFHWYAEELQRKNSKSDINHYVLLRDALEDNPIIFAESPAIALDLVRKGGYIMPTGTDSSRLYRASAYCDIDFILLSGSPKKYAQYIFRKNSTLTKRFNAAVISAQRLTNRVWDIYYGDVAEEKRSLSCQKSPNQLNPLSLKALIGLFALLMAGAATSVALMFVEILVKCWKNRNKSDASRKISFISN